VELDALDQQAAEAYDGFIVRKDLARRFKGQYPVPTYVGEFLLGRYCASIDEDEIQEGLAIVQRQLADRAVRAGEEELFKARAREQGTVKIIDLITARLDAATDSYVAILPGLRLKDVRIEPEMVGEHERMLTGGFYAEIELEYDAGIAQEKAGRPFGVRSLRAITMGQSETVPGTRWPRCPGQGCGPPRHRSARGLPSPQAGSPRRRRRPQTANVSVPLCTSPNGLANRQQFAGW
jgi:ATP-dependent Lon protease